MSVNNLATRNEITGDQIYNSLKQPAASTLEAVLVIDYALELLAQRYSVEQYLDENPNISDEEKKALLENDPNLDFLYHLYVFIKKNLNLIPINKLITVVATCYELFSKNPTYQIFIKKIDELKEVQIDAIVKQIDELVLLEKKQQVIATELTEIKADLAALSKKTPSDKKGTTKESSLPKIAALTPSEILKLFCQPKTQVDSGSRSHYASTISIPRSMT